MAMTTTPRTPDELPIPGAITARNWMIGIAIISGLVSYGAYNNGDGATCFWAAVIGIGLFWGGCSIKTSKKKIAEGGLYR
jgi:hypothetical protein